jgi:ParB-like chromosome segregation protein Spo0J
MSAVLEELMGHLGEASKSIRAARRLLLEHAPDDNPGHLRLLARLAEALDATEMASREARRQRGIG